MESYLVTEQLHDGDHAGAQLLIRHRRGHQHPQGLIGSTGQIAKKLSVMEGIRAEHLWNGEHPHDVRHVLEHFVEKEGAKGGRSLRIHLRQGCGGQVARGTDAALTTREAEQQLALAVLATKPSETVVPLILRLLDIDVCLLLK